MTPTKRMKKMANEKFGTVEIMVPGMFLGGWASGSYSCKCVNCGAEHFANKRASSCLRCAINRENDEKAKLKTRITELAAMLDDAMLDALPDLSAEKPADPIRPVRHMQKDQSIVAAAVQFEGLTYSLPRPARHGQVLHCLHGILSDTALPTVCQGFLTSDGQFVNRIMARAIAWTAGQIPDGTQNELELFSEDLW